MSKPYVAWVEVEIRYRGNPDSLHDEQVRKFARTYKGKEVGSGYFLPSGVRDMVFRFKSAAAVYAFVVGLQMGRHKAEKK